MPKIIVTSGNGPTADHNMLASSRPAAIGSLPKPSLYETVNLPGQPVTYRVRRDIVVSAARGIKVKP